MPTVIRYLIVMIILLTLLSSVVLSGIYIWFSPLTNALAGHFADTLGVDDVTINSGRPGFTAIDIKNFRVRKNGTVIEGSSGTLTYDLMELFDGRLQSLRFASVEVTVSPNTEISDEADPSQSIETPLPGTLFAMIPVAEFNVDALSLDVPRLKFAALGSIQIKNDTLTFALSGQQPVEAEHFSVEGEMDSRGSIHVRFLDVTMPSNPFFEVDSTFAAVNGAPEISIDASFDLSNYALQLTSELAGIPPGNGTLKGDLHTTMPWPIVETTLDNVTVQGRFALNWRDAEKRFWLRNLRGAVSAQRNSADAQLAGGEIELGNSILLLSIPPGYSVAYSDPMITLGAGLNFSMTSGDLTVKGSTRSVEARLGSVPMIDFDTNLSVNGFELATGGRAAAHLELTPNGELVSGTGTVTLGNINLMGTFDHNLADGTGSLSSEQKTVVTTPLLKSLFQQWVHPYDITAGEITSTVKLVWSEDDPIQGEVAISMSGLDGAYDEYLFNNLSGKLFVKLSGEEVELTPSPISITRADVGLELSNISFESAWKNDTLSLEGMEMQVLGGTVSFSPVTFDSDQTSSVELELIELSLAKVLALEGDNIGGTGALSGRLPLQMSKGRISMKGGQLSAQPPGGTIRLSTDFGTSTGQLGLDFAMTALTNFKYSTLVVNADYAENGDLALAVKLQGTNPEVEKGRPIVYNLTISENIPVLLESLRAQRAIVEHVEQKVLGNP